MTENTCSYTGGLLPECAPLALAYVPMQQSSLPAFDRAEALARGTLFPGLDLPFMNIVNQAPKTLTPLCELMAIDFVAHELALYLDTHKDDAEAFATFQGFLRLSAEAHRRYVELCGPLTHADMATAASYTWLKNPWPWDYAVDREG